MTKEYLRRLEMLFSDLIIHRKLPKFLNIPLKDTNSLKSGNSGRYIINYPNCLSMSEGLLKMTNTISYIDVLESDIYPNYLNVYDLDKQYIFKTFELISGFNLTLCTKSESEIIVGLLNINNFIKRI